MDFDDAVSMRRILAERLGEDAGRKFATLARPGFRLDRSTDTAPATGRSRLGGPALLDPGTPWPHVGGVPLSLHAVLDIDALDIEGLDVEGLGIDARPGLLNFFYLDPDVPYEQYQRIDTTGTQTCRVIPADPIQAIEVVAPEPARSYPATPLTSSARIALPDCWDVEDGDVEYDRDEHWGPESLILAELSDIDMNTAGQHYAFGWPDTSYTVKVTHRDADGPAVHLLQLAQDAELGWGWGDAGTVYFTIPVKAFASGDYSKATAVVLCC
ncbi:uncharacterized protein YwqG [Catenulispora sp. GP43]|uniref:DUF1963 domain-containing protein n=1 Tax=Catenulispora sp. GP43 TaxID=3156263 RepID=UPI003513425C